MEKVKVKAVLNDGCKLPNYETKGAAGMDLRANVKEKIRYMYKCERDGGKLVLNPGARVLFGTGLHIQLPDGYEAQIRPRSGLSLKYGIVCMLGTVDSDFTGEIGLIIFNLGDEPYTVTDGDRLAQMVICKVAKAEFEVVESLDETERGSGGFGHTGT